MELFLKLQVIVIFLTLKVSYSVQTEYIAGGGRGKGGMTWPQAAHLPK